MGRGGYTVIEVRGEGSRGYFAHFAVVAYVDSVEVVSGDKYV